MEKAVRSFHYETFTREFESRLASTNSYKEAYEQTEKTFEEKVGHRYYSSWESFKSQRSKRNRK